MTESRPPAGRAPAPETDRLRLDQRGGRLQVAAATHVGKVRKNNEDFAVTETIERAGVAYRLLLVADGMGGGAKGEVASELAAALVARHLKEEPWAGPHEALAEAFKEANAVVYDRGTGGGEAPRSLMGTTLVAVLVDDGSGRAWLAHAGDSRAYLLPATGGIQRLTRDHSLVQERAREAQMTEEEAEKSTDRNVITRAIGPQPDVEAELTGPIVLSAGDLLLLSTDGLHGMVADERIRRTVARSKKIDGLAAELIRAGLAGGGRDNVTVVVAAWDRFPATGGASGDGSASRLAPIAAALGAVGIVFVVAGLAWIVLQGEATDSPAEVSGETATALPTAPTPALPTANPTPVPKPRMQYKVLEDEQCSDVVAKQLSIYKADVATRKLRELNGIDAACSNLPVGFICIPNDVDMNAENPLPEVLAVDNCQVPTSTSDSKETG